MDIIGNIVSTNLSNLSTLNQFSLHVLRSLEVLDMSAVTTCENFSKTADTQKYQWLNASPKIIYLSNDDMEKAVANHKDKASNPDHTPAR